MTITVAITGASGAIYAQRLVAKLIEMGHDVAVIFTDNGRKVALWELGEQGVTWSGAKEYANGDFFVPIASGSAVVDAMVIVPCSMGMAGRLAAGISNDLVSRAADVMLKESGRLVVVPRECPMSLIHLQNLVTLKQAGAVIMPASPSFYSRAQDIPALVDTVVERILQQIGLPYPKSYKWNGE